MASGNALHSGILKVYYDKEVREVKPAVDTYYEEDKTFIDAVVRDNGSAIKSPYHDALKTLEVIAADPASREKRVITLK